jgi:hypothetical protein
LILGTREFRLEEERDKGGFCFESCPFETPRSISIALFTALEDIVVAENVLGLGTESVLVLDGDVLVIVLRELVELESVGRRDEVGEADSDVDVEADEGLRER